MFWNFVTVRLTYSLSPSYSTQNKGLCKSWIWNRQRIGTISGSGWVTAVTVFTHSSSLILLGWLGKVYWKFPAKSSWHRMQPLLYSKLHSWRHCKHYLNAAPPTDQTLSNMANIFPRAVISLNWQFRPKFSNQRAFNNPGFKMRWLQVSSYS